MSLLSRAEAQRIVGPHFGGLFDIISGAWNEYMTQYSIFQRMKHCPTTRASIVHDLMVERAARYFIKVANATITDSAGLKIFTLEETGKLIAIRFKKLDDQLLSRNQQTQQVKDFRGQNQLDCIGAADHLEAGYVLDREQLAIQSISLVCPNGPKNYWDIELSEVLAVTNVHDLFDAEPADDKVNIVRGKATTEPAQKNQSDNEGKD